MSKMADKMAAVLDFTKISNLSVYDVVSRYHGNRLSPNFTKMYPKLTINAPVSIFSNQQTLPNVTDRFFTGRLVKKTYSLQLPLISFFFIIFLFVYNSKGAGYWNYLKK